MKRRVLVTGAASGLGAALVRAFEADGDEVLGTDIRPSVVEEGDATTRTRPLRGLDVTSEDDWAAAVEWVEEHWGGLDILVNNAGVAGGGRIEQCTLEEWRWITEINLYGVVNGTRAFTPMLKRQHSGHLVNVASLAGFVHPAGMGSYNAVKAAVVAFTETCGHELHGWGITAHAVCPSYFRTNLMDSLQGNDAAVGAVLSRLVTESPVTADDIAAEVLRGIDAGTEVILPDDAARAAVALKQTDRAAYDTMMRRQAAKLEAHG